MVLWDIYSIITAAMKLVVSFNSIGIIVLSIYDGKQYIELRLEEVYFMFTEWR